MNEISRIGSTPEEIARIREVVGRHKLPGFVLGFDVELGEFDDEPAVWVVFHTDGVRPVERAARLERMEALGRLRDEVDRALWAEPTGRFPYYRFRHGAAGSVPT